MFFNWAIAMPRGCGNFGRLKTRICKISRPTYKLLVVIDN